MAVGRGLVRRASGLHFRVELGVVGEGRSLFALRRTGTRESHWDQGSNLYGGGQGVSILIPFFVDARAARGGWSEARCERAGSGHPRDLTWSTKRRATILHQHTS